jgi:hypothetical protein
MRTSSPCRAAALALAMLLAPRAWAVRPFITDDARVVGKRLGQVESWLRGDRAAVEHWVLLAYGPTEQLELTLGHVHGAQYDTATRYIVAGPLIQAKYLLWTPQPNRRPGLALSGGATAPLGSFGFAPEHWDTFLYAALSESLLKEDRVLLHLNLGGVKQTGGGSMRATWGVGSQFRVRGGFHGVAELISGDPYAEGASRAIQVGFRHFFSDRLQIDATYGKGLGLGGMPAWASVGVRIVSPPLGRETFRKLRRR